MEKAQGRSRQAGLDRGADQRPAELVQAEAERFAPQLKVLALYGGERKGLFGEIARHDLVLTTYPLLARDHETLLPSDFHSAILDEAQAIKNPKAAMTGWSRTASRRATGSGAHRDAA